MRTSRLLLAAALVPVSYANAQGTKAPQGPPQGTLAKALLPVATAEAKKWKADARLIQIASTRVTDGKAMWDYGFYSPTAPADQNCAMVNVLANGKAYTRFDKGCDQTEIQDFIDSDKAADIARKAGLTQPQFSMGLLESGSSNQPGIVWMVMDGTGMKTGDRSVDIDAKTGAVLNKSRMP